jgi:environmental stress-induced protein Ves
VHGTTYEQVLARWDADQFAMQPTHGRPLYDYNDDDTRKVACDAYVNWQASRYSVPWQYAGKQVCVRQSGDQVEVHYGCERIAVHRAAQRRHQVITNPIHHEGIPLGADDSGGKILVHLRETAPTVESRPLAAYESLALGGVQ